MLGVGPEWVHATKYGMTTNSVAGEVVLDFMLSPLRETSIRFVCRTGLRL
jgi:hypothetical protein